MRGYALGLLARAASRSRFYVDTRRRAGHPDRIKAFVELAAAPRWFKAIDPHGVAFQDEVIEQELPRPRRPRASSSHYKSKQWRTVLRENRNLV